MNKSNTNLILAEKVFGWRREENFFVPPENSPRIGWCAKWDEDGFPDWLPDYENGYDRLWVEELGSFVIVKVVIEKEI